MAIGEGLWKLGTDPLRWVLPLRTPSDRLTYTLLSVGGLTLFIYAAVIGDFSRWLLPFNQAMLLGGATAAGVAITTVYAIRSPYIASTAAPVILALSVLWSALTAAAMARGYPVQTCLLMYGPVVAAALSFTDRRILLRLLLAVLAISAVVQAWELVNGRYLFIVVSWGEALDEEVTSGISGILRAKGLFAGPTVAAAFSILCCAIFPPSRTVLLLVLATAAMTASRSAFVFAAVYVMGLLVFADRGRRATSIGAVVILAGILFLVASSGMLGTRLSRLLTLGLYDDSANQTRLYLWSWSWDVFLNIYTNAQRFLGGPRDTYTIFTSSAESQPLQYLLDTGIIGFLTYAVALVLTWRAAAKLTAHDKAAFLAVSVVSLVVPLYNQSGLNILFWLYAYGLWHRAYALKPVNRQTGPAMSPFAKPQRLESVHRATPSAG